MTAERRNHQEGKVETGGALRALGFVLLLWLSSVLVANVCRESR